MGVYESGDRMKYMFFSTERIISLRSVMMNGEMAEIALTGNEGMVGISLFLGGASTPREMATKLTGKATSRGTAIEKIRARVPGTQLAAKAPGAR